MDSPLSLVVIERLVAENRDVDVTGMRIGATVGTPTPRRLARAKSRAAENFPIGYNVFDPRVARDQQHLGNAAGVDAVCRVVGDVHRRDHAVRVRIVVGPSSLVGSIANRAVARLVTVRRHLVDLAAQGFETLCHSPRHGLPRC
jgi:hypothetical protein